MNYRLTCYAFLTLTLTLFASAQGTKSPGPGTRHDLLPLPRPSDHHDAQHERARHDFRAEGISSVARWCWTMARGITESATIQTICRGHSQTVTHTDSRGGFSFEFGDRTSAAMAGISEADVDSAWSPCQRRPGKPAGLAGLRAAGGAARVYFADRSI